MGAPSSRTIRIPLLLAVAITLSACTYSTIPGSPVLRSTSASLQLHRKDRNKIRFMVLIQGIPCLKNGYGIPVGSRFRAKYITNESMHDNFCYDRAPLGWYPLELYFTHPLSGLYSLRRADLRELPLRLDNDFAPERHKQLEYIAPIDYEIFRNIFDHPKNLLVVRIRSVDIRPHWSRYLSMATIGILPGYTTISYRTSVVYYDASGSPRRLSGDDPVLKRWKGLAFLGWGKRLSRTPEELIATRVTESCEVLACNGGNDGNRKKK